MKKNKKIVALCLSVCFVIIYIIYKNNSNNQYEEIEYDETENIVEEIKEEYDYIVLHITGEVNNPGIIKIYEGSRVVDAIEAAGGITDNANMNKINLAYMLADGQKIYIPSIYDEDDMELITNDIGKNIIEDNPLKQNELININNATQTELESLTGIGPSTALKIINYRKENGNFRQIEDIKNVPGIGNSKYEAIKNQICI